MSYIYIYTYINYYALPYFKKTSFFQAMSENSFRATVYLCASATGFKMKPMIVFAGAPGGPGSQELTTPLYDHEKGFFMVQRTAYTDETVMLNWIDEVTLYIYHDIS